MRYRIQIYGSNYTLNSKSNILVLMIFSTRFAHYIHNKKHGNGTKPGFHATSAFDISQNF